VRLLGEPIVPPRARGTRPHLERDSNDEPVCDFGCSIHVTSHQFNPRLLTFSIHPRPAPTPDESDVDYWAWEVVLPLFVAIEAAVSLLAGALRTAPAARSRLNPVAIAAELTWKAPA
jgi:hypothetical protein